jgi:hypothetical protein
MSYEIERKMHSQNIEVTSLGKEIKKDKTDEF